MSKSDSCENSILKLIYNATTWTNIAQDGASPITSIYVALHTADPADAGTQSTSEISYTGYARVAVVRTSSGWTVTANSVSPVAAITFGQMTAGTGGTVTHFSTGSVSSGATLIFHSGTVTPNIVVSNGVTPQLSVASTITED